MHDHVNNKYREIDDMNANEINTNAAPIVLVVGCQPVTHEDAPRFEKRWFLINDQGQFDPQTFKDALAAVQISVAQGELVLRAPGMLRLDIPMDVIEDDDSVCREVTVGHQTVKVVDEGDLAAVWFGNVIGKPCRLVKVHPEAAVPVFD